MPYTGDIFNAFPSGDDLEQAVLDTLKAWWLVYAREFELQHDMVQDALPFPKLFVTSERLDRDSADALPAVVVVSPGYTQRPKQQGDGTFRCFFSVGIGIFVSAPQRPDVKRLVRQYTAIAKYLILQRQSLGGYADGVTLIDESWDDNFRFTDTATTGVGQVVFEIEASGGSRYGGPADSAEPDPETQPGSDWPTATNVTFTIDALPPEDEQVDDEETEE